MTDKATYLVVVRAPDGLDPDELAINVAEMLYHEPATVTARKLDTAHLGVSDEDRPKFVSDAPLEEVLTELWAYADAGPAASRKACGRAVLELKAQMAV